MEKYADKKVNCKKNAFLAYYTAFYKKLLLSISITEQEKIIEV